MHYRINVALNGLHFFATSDHSLTSERKAREVYRELRARFPASEGYEVDAQRWESTGRDVDLSR